MKFSQHASAKPSHYNKEAETYDIFNEKNAAIINQTIEHVLKQHHVKTVLDLTCGTGSQVFWLAERGYDVVGADINAQMLKVARDKARLNKAKVRLLKGDMRTIKVGKFDAVLTIFNAVGHLTQSDFQQAMRNIHDNLNDGGLYVFDIFNLDYLLHGDNITKLTIDWLQTAEDSTERVIQYSTISKEGVLGSATTTITQRGDDCPRLAKSVQTLQIYSADQLAQMLANAGFKVLMQFDVDGSLFMKNTTERILTVAQKLG